MQARARHSARTDGGTLGPSSDPANGSPGARRISANVAVTTMNTTTAPWARRRARYRRTLPHRRLKPDSIAGDPLIGGDRPVRKSRPPGVSAHAGHLEAT